MLKLSELVSYLNQKLNIDSFKDYCPNGIQVEGKSEIKKVATGVTASLKTIQTAVEIGADALIVHHGIFWNRDEWPIVGTKREKLKLLLENQISLLVYHLPLDAHREIGNNWVAAKEMNWTELEPFGELDGKEIGVKGRFPKLSVADFQKKLEAYYKHPAYAALGGKGFVETAGLISGGAYRAVTDAAKEGLDCFVCGNFDEPAWHHAFEEKIHFFALGHTATERIGPRTLGEDLRKVFGVETSFLEIENPF